MGALKRDYLTVITSRPEGNAPVERSNKAIYQGFCIPSSPFPYRVVRAICGSHRPYTARELPAVPPTPRVCLLWEGRDAFL